MMRDLNVSLSIVMPHRDLSFSRTKSSNLVGDISPRNTLPSITHHGPTMMSSMSIARRQRAYDERKRNNTDETSADYFTARRLVKSQTQQ